MDTLIFKIGDKDIEVDDIKSFPFVISYKLEELFDFQKKRSAESFGVTVPASVENSRAANSFHDPNVEDLSPGKAYSNPQPCQIIANGIEVISGKALLQSASHTDRPENYVWDIYGNNGDWLIDLQEKTLWDFVSPAKHTFDKPTVEDSWTFTGQFEFAEYVYAPVRYRTRFDGSDDIVTMYHMRPALSIYWIIYRAFKSVGYTIKSEFFDSSYFRRMVMPWVWGNFLRLDNKLLDILRFRARVSSGYNRNNLGSGTSFGVNDLLTTSGNGFSVNNDNSLGGYDNGNNYEWTGTEMKWTYPVAQYNEFGPLIFGFMVRLRIVATVTWNSNVDINIEWFKNGVQIGTSNAKSLAAGATSTVGFDGSVDVFWESPSMSGGDYVWARVRVSGFKTFFSGQYSVSILGDPNFESFLEISYFKKPLGGLVDFKLYERFKNYKFLDLLRGICDTFDIIPNTDSVSKQAYFEPAHPYILDDSTGVEKPGYFKSTRLDWTEKQDMSKLNTVLQFRDTEREMIFKFKDDTSDSGLNKYIARYAVDPGSSKYLFPERFRKGNSTVENRFFSPVTHLLATNWKNITGVAPQIVALIPENISNNSSTEEQETAFQPKIVYYKGLVDRNTYGGWNWDGDTSKNFPFMFAVNYKSGGQNDPILTYNDQLINGNTLGRGLMRRFFLSRLAIMDYGKIYETFLNLNNGDIIDWLHRDRVIINKGTWLLYEIEKYSPFINASTLCRLWKYIPASNDNISKCYPSQSSVINATKINDYDLKYATLLLLNTDIPK